LLIDRLWRLVLDLTRSRLRIFQLAEILDLKEFLLVP
jgi:hypothetical protein